MSLKNLVVGAVSLFGLLSVFLLIQHEISVNFHIANGIKTTEPQIGKANLRDIFMKKISQKTTLAQKTGVPVKVQEQKPLPPTIAFGKDQKELKV